MYHIWGRSVHNMQWSHVLFENRDFCLPHAFDALCCRSQILSQIPSPGRYSGINYEWLQILIQLFNFGVRPQLLSTEKDRRLTAPVRLWRCQHNGRWLWTTDSERRAQFITVDDTVINWARHSESVACNHRPLCWQEADQLLFALRCCFVLPRISGSGGPIRRQIGFDWPSLSCFVISHKADEEEFNMPFPRRRIINLQS